MKMMGVGRGDLVCGCNLTLNIRDLNKSPLQNLKIAEMA
jgi:hypothetical protein